MEKITENTMISDCLKINENAGQILAGFGMRCMGCAMARGETVGQAATTHGHDVNELLEKLNENL